MITEALMAAAITLGGFTVQPPLPEVVVLNTEEMRELYCNSTCKNVPVGMFLDRHPTKVFVQEGVIDGDVTKQSYLFHEIVHYLQYQQGKMKANPTCQEWLALEMEAFDVQEKWLAAQYTYLIGIGRLRYMYARTCDGETK